MRTAILAAVVAAALAAPSLPAAPPPAAGAQAAPPAGGISPRDRLLAESLARRLGRAPDRIEPAPLPGWRFAIFGEQAALVSADGRWLVDGAVISLERGEDVLAERRRGLLLDAVEGFGEANMIVFPARGAERHRLTVFTDVDCPYCRRFHQEVPALNEAGVTVRYVPFSLVPAGTERRRRMESVWCAKDRRAALTAAKAGEAVPARRCEDPVEAGTRLGRRLGFEGTPTIVTGRGRVLRGYVPRDRLLGLLAREKDAAAGTRAERGQPRPAQ